MEKIKALQLPEKVKTALTSACQALLDKSRGDVAALVLFGSAARGRYVEGSSDLNLLVIFDRAPIPTLRAIGPVLRDAYRTCRLEPMLITRDELVRSADVFPTKFKDVVTSHVVLHGDAKLSELKFTREHLRLRVEQELRNLALRFRRRFAAQVDTVDTLRVAISETTPAFAAELFHLLDLSGTPVSADADLAGILSAAAKKFDLPAQPLSAAAALHDHPRDHVTDIEGVAASLLEALCKAADAADALPEAK